MDKIVHKNFIFTVMSYQAPKLNWGDVTTVAFFIFHFWNSKLTEELMGQFMSTILELGRFDNALAQPKLRPKMKPIQKGLKAWTILIHIGALKSGNRYNLEEPAMPKRKTYTYTQAQLPNNPTT